MTDEPGGEQAAGDRAASVAVRRRRSVSPIWFVPIVAALVAGWVAWSTITSRGPRIEIVFETAEGLQADSTKIKYKSVDVGQVEGVELSADLQQIIVHARMSPAIAAHLTSEAQFWIVQPRIGIGGVSGLSTLVSGSYIEFSTAPGGQPATRFVALEQPPLIEASVPGRHFTLTAKDLGSLGRGAPVYHRGVQVGQVLGYKLDDTSGAVNAEIFVQAPHDRLVTEATHFWDAGGIRLGAGAGGFQLAIPPLQAMLVGGVAFDTSATAGTPPAAAENATFRLYASEAEVPSDGGGLTQAYLAYFEGSVRGLHPGAPVEFRGIRIGTVESIRLEFDTDTRIARIPVAFLIEPWRFDVTGNLSQAIEVRPMEQLVERGLRAQLATANLLTGDLLVSLDFFPDAPAAKLGEADGVPVMPTVPTQLSQLTTSLTGILDRLAKLPLETMVDRANATLGSLDAIVSGEEVKETLAAAHGALTELRRLTSRVGDDVPAMTADLRAATSQLGETLTRLNGLLLQATTTVESANAILGPNSKMRYDLTEAISQLGAAARSFRGLADSLQRDPSALIRGRQTR